MPIVASGGQEYHRVHAEVRLPVEEVFSRIVEYVFGVIDAFVLARFILKMFGANAEASFVKLVYGISDVFMAPFNAIFQTQKVAGATFEWSALVAAAVYALIAWGIVGLVHAVSPRTGAATTEKIEEHHDETGTASGS